MSKMALLIIDMLNDFFRQHARLAEQRTLLVASINTLAEAFRQHDLILDALARHHERNSHVRQTSSSTHR